MRTGTKLTSARVPATCLLLSSLAACAMTGTPQDARAEYRAAASLPDYFACLREKGLTIASAHRGVSLAGFPENTVQAFAGLAHKDEMLGETDVRVTHDGVLFLNHDSRLDRTTTLSGDAAEYDWRAIADARVRDAAGAATSYHPASLSDLLAATRDGPVVQLEIKKNAAVAAVLDAVEAAGALRRVVYLVFNDADIAAIFARQPDAVVATAIPSLADLDRLIALGGRPDHLQAVFWDEEMDRDYFAALRERGVTVIVTPTPSEEAEKGVSRPLTPSRYVSIAASGAQIIVSNHPDAVWAALKQSVPAVCGIPGRG